MNVGVTKIGPVTIEPAEVFDLVNDATAAGSRAATLKLQNLLTRRGRRSQNVHPSMAARIPRPNGSDMWEFEAWVDEHAIRIWYSDGEIY
jgi:hypothetical protein